MTIILNENNHNILSISITIENKKVLISSVENIKLLENKEYEAHLIELSQVDKFMESYFTDERPNNEDQYNYVKNIFETKIKNIFEEEKGFTVNIIK